ncbi:MAG TPA: methyltransferase domain-containing protein [Polyangia bacterium]|jgi:SAM-dependent methyltransferase
MSDVPGYIHGYTDEEAQRLIDQAEFLAPWVFDGVTLDGVRTLLEVGMGVGAETRLLRARWPELRVIGCDIAEAQLGHARRVLAADIAAGAVELMRASATAVPLPSASADAGFVCWLLEHVPDPAAVMREVARVVKPGGRVFVTEVYNHSLTVEPTQPALERYWAALNATQRRAGGHPNIGARLGELAAAAGLEIVSHRFLPVLGDARDPARRAAIMRYFLTLMKSAEPQLRAAGAVDERELAAVWAGWEAALAAPDGLFAYTMCKLEARVR